MPASLADIRRFLTESFNDEELTTLCFDHFQDVYLEFTVDMTLGRKALQLVDYCRRRERVPELLSILRQERPEASRRVFGRIAKSADRRVNINTAEVDELLNLPGIGPALAAAIIAVRPFASVEELARVRGIGPRRLAALREWCTI
jgi:competence ComEA-like helix-hairpin-helix protein